MIIHFIGESLRDLVRVSLPVPKPAESVKNDDVHVDAAVDWLLRSIEACGGRASSKAYRIGKGWLAPYRETTGYIIPTLLDVAERRNRPELRLIAGRMGDWLAEVQDKEGGFAERELQPHGTKPIVFNTGQILHGFNALILRLGRSDLVPSARRAGDFLVSCTDDSGCFVRNVDHGIVHAYNARTAWALLSLGRLTGEKQYEDAALANADWTLAQQNANGFFLRNTFKPGGNANTHGIAYVLQGLLEIHFLSGEERFAAAVRRACETVVSVYRERRRLAAEIGEEWDFLSHHLCLTGYAQLAIVLFRLYGLDGDDRYLDAALSLLDEVAGTQNVSAHGRPHYGGIKGSYPIYGRYARLQYPNWAAKFFVDALLAKQQALNRRAESAPVQISAG